MTATDEGFMRSCTRTLKDFEPGIPGLRERMMVRTLRMLLENCVIELQTSEANSWERAVEIYIEMRDTIHALGSMGPGSNASRLCYAISGGLDTDPHDAIGITNQHTDDIGRVQLFVGLYEEVGNSLERLTADREFMLSMGNCGPHVYAEIIAQVRRTIQRGKLFINANSLH